MSRGVDQVVRDEAWRYLIELVTSRREETGHNVAGIGETAHARGVRELSNVR